MKTDIKFLVFFSLAALAVTLSHPVHGEIAGSLDPLFDPGVVPVPSFAPLAVQPDGRILVGANSGSFVRLNSDGTLENSASTGGGGVLALAVQSDGKIVLGGYFETINGQIRNDVARLDADGTVESTATFNPGNFINQGGLISCLALQADGKILLGGLFSISSDATPRHSIARLNTDGTVESTSTFSASARNPTGAESVDCIVVQADGKILLAGPFTIVNGESRNGIARLNPDGSLESGATFDPGAGANNAISCVVVQPDGKILIAGNFTSVNGQPRNRIARLNADGSLESTATFNVGSGANDAVYSVAVQANGRIVLAGAFTSVNGQARNYITRLHPDGALGSTVTFNPGTGPENVVYAVALQADGKILVGGAFTHVNGVPRSRFARLINDAG